MSIANLLLFAGIYAVAVASPGPGIAALVARVLVRGPVGIGAFIAGFVVGDLVWFGVAAAGMALLARSLAVAFVVLKYAGAVYLAVLAWKAWTAPLEPIETERVDADGRIRLFFCGLVLTLGNPKVILFFLALLPGVVDLDRLTLLGFAEIGAVLSAVLCAYAGAADRARRVFTSIRARRAINRSAGTVMAGAAVAIATRRASREGGWNVGLRKIVADEQEWDITSLGAGIGEAVAEVEARGVAPALSVAVMREDRMTCVSAIDRHDGDFGCCQKAADLFLRLGGWNRTETTDRQCRFEDRDRRCHRGTRLFEPVYERLEMGTRWRIATIADASMNITAHR